MDLQQAEKAYKEYLKHQNMFFTKERAIILSAVLKKEGHFSVDELVFDMQKEGLKASRATLYRSISQLSEAGILEEADFGHGHVHYEIADHSKPHVHLVCKQCGKVFEAESSEVEETLTQLCQSNKFKMTSHKMTIMGICNNCSS